MTFLDLFHDAANRAITEGMHPQYIYLGPDVVPIFADYAAELLWFAHDKPPTTKAERLQAILQSDNLGIFHGMQIHRMECQGLAVSSHAPLESGFDL